MKKILSVIVPVYNVELYLNKCIESLLNQKLSTYEIILVDDGSTDSSGEICDEFSKNHDNICVIHQKNQGLVAARKTGISIAKGEYITFVDSDDWIDQDIYEFLMMKMDSEDADILETGMTFEYDDITEYYLLENAVYLMNDNNRKGFVLNYIYLDSGNRNFKEDFSIFHSLCNKIFKKELIEASYNKVPNECSYGEDYIAYLYCILTANKIQRVKNAYYHYMQRDSSISHGNVLDILTKKIELLKIIKNILLESKLILEKKKVEDFFFSEITRIFILNYSKEFSSENQIKLSTYFYPRIEELQNKKIMIYGAGNVGIDYVKQISLYENCTIVSWIDKNYQNILQPDFRSVHGLDDLCKDFDYILIAVLDENIATEIKKELLLLGIQENKIIWKKPQIKNLIEHFKLD